METPIPRSRGVDNLAALDRECNRGLGIPRSRGVDNLAALDRECNRGLGIPRSWGVDDLAALDRECNRDSDSEEEISNFANAENSPEGTDKNTN